MPSIEGTTRFVYSTLFPSIFLLPLWFVQGRYWMLGVNDWVVTENSNERYWPAFVVFSTVLWRRERKRDPQIPEVALALWGVYLLQLVLQVFVVTPGNTAHDASWSVAHHYWNMSLEASQKMAVGLTADLWMAMSLALLVSYWTPDSAQELSMSTVPLVQRRMTDSLKSARFYVPLWYAFGHWTLGSASWEGWLQLSLEALLVVLPFHCGLYWLCKNTPLLSPTQATFILFYYSLLFFSQFFLMPTPNQNFVVAQYFHLNHQTIHTVAWAFKGLLLTLMLVLLGLTYYNYHHSQQESSTSDAEELREPLLATEAATSGEEGVISPTAQEDSNNIIAGRSSDEQPEEPPLQETMNATAEGPYTEEQFTTHHSST